MDDLQEETAVDSDTDFDLSITVNDSCSITMLERAMISDLVNRKLVKNKSVCYRNAIRMYYSSFPNPKFPLIPTD